MSTPQCQVPGCAQPAYWDGKSYSFGCSRAHLAQIPGSPPRCQVPGCERAAYWNGQVLSHTCSRTHQMEFENLVGRRQLATMLPGMPNAVTRAAMVTQGQSLGAICFHKVQDVPGANPNYAFFGNFFPVPISWYGYQAPCVESAYQGEKFLRSLEPVTSPHNRAILELFTLTPTALFNNDPNLLKNWLCYLLNRALTPTEENQLNNVVSQVQRSNPLDQQGELAWQLGQMLESCCGVPRRSDWLAVNERIMQDLLDAEYSPNIGGAILLTLGTRFSWHWGADSPNIGV